MSQPKPLPKRARAVRWPALLGWLASGCAATESQPSAALAEPAPVASVSAPIPRPVPSPSAAAAPICKAEACWTLGVREKEPARSAAYYREGCKQDHPRSCDFLAQMLDDPSCGRSFCLNDEGIAVARRGCSLGAKSSCFYIAETLREKADKAELEQLYTFGCDDTSSLIREQSCRAAADHALARGDLAKAASLAEKTCQNDTPPRGDQPAIQGAKGGCSLYGFLLATGQGVKQDERKGRELLRLMCSLDEQAACDFLQQLERDKK